MLLSILSLALLQTLLATANARPQTRDTTTAAELATGCTTLSKGGWKLYYSGSDTMRNDAQWYSMTSFQKFSDPSQVCSVAIAKDGGSCASVANAYNAKQFSLTFTGDYSDPNGPWLCQVYMADNASPNLFTRASGGAQYVWAWTI